MKKDIIIYGIGTDYEKNKLNIEREYNVVGYIDKRVSEDLSVPRIRLENLEEEKYDYILITSTRHFCKLYSELRKIGVENNKIMGFEGNELWKAVCEIENYIEGIEYKTSLSEESYYPFVCRAAVDNTSVFDNFRRNPIYTQILEHVSYEQGLQYLKLIEEMNEKNACFRSDEWDKFIKNDNYGNPQTYQYNVNGDNIMISPTTLRYVKVLCDLHRLFPVNKINKIVEIGVGYGGQCRVIMSNFSDVESYTLVDLKVVLDLSRKYLNMFSKSSKIHYMPGEETDSCFSDLVISNYAFSELRREIQDMYLEKIILKSKAGYITWNSLGQKEYDSYSVEELLKVIPNSFVIEEKPLTLEDNCIIYWSNIV